MACFAMRQAIAGPKRLDGYGNVLYLSTFSKLLFPGFRVGWVSAPGRFCTA